MTKLFHGFMGLGLLGGCLACVVAAKPAQTSNRPQQLINITKLYEDTCAKCHGSGGEGGPAGTHTLNTKEKFDQKNDRPFFDAIKVGVKSAGMEPYGETMRDEEMWGLVVHIRELQKKALRAEFGGATPGKDRIFKTKLHTYKVETVVEKGKGLVLPWSMSFLKDGRFLVTNRSGFMFLVDKGELSPKVEGLPRSVEQGQGGLMEVAVHPTNGWVYLSISDPKKDGRGAMTKIVRGKLDLSSSTPKFTNEESIWEADQKHYNGSGAHFGSKIVFDGKGHLYFSVGERGGNDPALDPTIPWGKTYRLNEDGSVPKDNPKFKQAGAVRGLFTMGHRNPQGLTLDAEGNVWDTEHGPRGGDELNLLKGSESYGWPAIAHSINYNDAAYWVPWNRGKQNYTLPVYRWLPSIGASGLDLMKGKAFPAWNGDLLAGGLAGNNIDRIRVKNGKLVEVEEILFRLGRVRDIRVGPEGYIYIVLNDPHMIVRLVPVK